MTLGKMLSEYWRSAEYNGEEYLALEEAEADEGCGNGFSKFYDDPESGHMVYYSAPAIKKENGAWNLESMYMLYWAFDDDTDSIDWHTPDDVGKYHGYNDVSDYIEEATA